MKSAERRFENRFLPRMHERCPSRTRWEVCFHRLTNLFQNPFLLMASYTITEKGYRLRDPQGNYFPFVEKDIQSGPEVAVHTMSMVTGLLYKRYLKNGAPMTLVSMDNCYHNGDKLKAAVLDIAQAWIDNGFMEEGFLAYLKDETQISFPLSMIDKITPRPAEAVEKVLEEAGLEDMAPIITKKGSYMAPFVNAEICEYLVIEDKFTNGRPRLEEAGVIFTDRETVNKVETMKVTTCLNPLHTALAVSGSLLGFTSIAEQVQDEDMKKLIHRIGYSEGLPVVVNPGIIHPKTFIDEVVEERFANPYIPDTPQRIATDTSQKVGIRFGETIKSYAKRDDLNPQDLVAIPLAIAIWCRYLLAVDDQGQAFDLSADPLLETLQGSLKTVSLGGQSVGEVKAILANTNLFGLNLYEVGLGQKIEQMFLEMLSGPGAVRASLQKYLA